MADLLVCAKDIGQQIPGPEGLSLIWHKGDIAEVYESPHAFQAKEGLPTFVQIRITDRTKAQVDQFVEQWIKQYRATSQGSNATYDFFRCEVRPEQVSQSGDGAAFPQSAKDALLAEFSGEVHDQTATRLDMKVPIGTATVKDIELVMADSLDLPQAFRKFYFDPDALDTVIANGGQQVTTWAQAGQYVINRLNL